MGVQTAKQAMEKYFKKSRTKFIKKSQKNQESRKNNSKKSQKKIRKSQKYQNVKSRTKFVKHFTPLITMNIMFIQC